VLHVAQQERKAGLRLLRGCCVRLERGWSVCGCGGCVLLERSWSVEVPSLGEFIHGELMLGVEVQAPGADGAR
jgi:hypothetical protein